MLQGQSGFPAATCEKTTANHSMADLALGDAGIDFEEGLLRMDFRGQT